MKIGRRPYLRTLTAESVVVHTRDDASLRGVLLAVHSDVYEACAKVAEADVLRAHEAVTAVAVAAGGDGAQDHRRDGRQPAACHTDAG
jgi:hypothetical protein